MPRRVWLLLLLLCSTLAGSSYAQDFSGIAIHGFVTQGFLFSSHNNYLTTQSSSGSLQWTDGAISTISDADVRAVFLGTKTKLADGSHAVPVTLRGGPVHEVFLRKHVGESPDEFRAQWRKEVFTGQGAMPRAFENESALIEYVAATPGALGYVSRVSTNDKVKCIPIIK